MELACGDIGVGFFQGWIQHARGFVLSLLPGKGQCEHSLAGPSTKM